MAVEAALANTWQNGLETDIFYLLKFTIFVRNRGISMDKPCVEFRYNSKQNIHENGGIYITRIYFKFQKTPINNHANKLGSALLLLHCKIKLY